MHDKWVHVPSLLAEAGNAITTLFGCTKLELKKRLISGAHDTEIVGHC